MEQIISTVIYAIYFIYLIEYMLFDVSQAFEQMAKYKADSAGGDNFKEGRHLRTLHPMSSLAELTIPLLQNIEKQLKTDLQIVREVCYLFSYLFVFHSLCLNQAFLATHHS